MSEGKSCIAVPIEHSGKNYAPVRFGHEKAAMVWITEFSKCPDCAVKKGGYHHPGCDCEECPVCGGQLLSCGCNEYVECVSQKKALQIINTRKPLGIFYTTEPNGTFTGIDNSTGEAWTEEFKDLNVCKKWLNGEIELGDEDDEHE